MAPPFDAETGEKKEEQGMIPTSRSPLRRGGGVCAGSQRIPHEKEVKEVAVLLIRLLLAKHLQNGRASHCLNRLQLKEAAQAAVIGHGQSAILSIGASDGVAAETTNEVQSPLGGVRIDSQSAYAVGHGVRPSDLSAVQDLLNRGASNRLDGIQLKEVAQTAVVGDGHGVVLVISAGNEVRLVQQTLLSQSFQLGILAGLIHLEEHL